MSLVNLTIYSKYHDNKLRLIIYINDMILLNYNFDCNGKDDFCKITNNKYLKLTEFIEWDEIVNNNTYIENFNNNVIYKFHNKDDKFHHYINDCYMKFKNMKTKINDTVIYNLYHYRKYDKNIKIYMTIKNNLIHTEIITDNIKIQCNSINNLLKVLTDYVNNNCRINDNLYIPINFFRTMKLIEGEKHIVFDSYHEGFKYENYSLMCGHLGIHLNIFNEKLEYFDDEVLISTTGMVITINKNFLDELISDDNKMRENDKVISALPKEIICEKVDDKYYLYVDNQISRNEIILSINDKSMFINHLFPYKLTGKEVMKIVDELCIKLKIKTIILNDQSTLKHNENYSYSKLCFMKYDSSYYSQFGFTSKKHNKSVKHWKIVKEYKLKYIVSDITNKTFNIISKDHKEFYKNEYDFNSIEDYLDISLKNIGIIIYQKLVKDKVENDNVIDNLYRILFDVIKYSDDEHIIKVFN